MTPRRWLRACLGALLLCTFLPCGPAMGWGSMAHGLFTSSAVDRLPGALGNFFRANRDFLVCYSVLPDDWWGSPDLVPQLPAGLEMPAGTPGRPEVNRHFFAVDDEAYREARGAHAAMTQSPLDRAAALVLFQGYVARHGQQALDRFVRQNPGYTGGLAGLPQALLDRAGLVVWVVQERLADLAAAMKAGNWQRALFLATVMGHYVGDSHVPLHTATDYNGAAYPNPLVKGIHARWEARMLERNEPEVKAFLAGQQQTPRPSPLTAENVPAYVFKTVSDSYSFVDEVYATDNELLSGQQGHTATPAPPKRLEAGASGAPPEDASVYTSAYYASLYGKLGPAARGRLWLAADDVVLFWNLAWELAGKPTPPTGKIETPALFVIDYKHGRLVPYDPTVGPRE